MPLALRVGDFHLRDVRVNNNAIEYREVLQLLSDDYDIVLGLFITAASPAVWINTPVRPIVRIRTCLSGRDIQATNGSERRFVSVSGDWLGLIFAMPTDRRKYPVLKDSFAAHHTSQGSNGLHRFPLSSVPANGPERIR